MLFPIVAKVRRRSEETRPDGLQFISDPETPTFELDRPRAARAKATDYCRLACKIRYGKVSDFVYIVPSQSGTPLVLEVVPKDVLQMKGELSLNFVYGLYLAIYMESGAGI